MTGFTQLLLLICSYLYGIIFYLLTRYNLFITKHLSTLKSFLVTLVFIVDMVILYIYLIYRANDGIFHIYFILLLILGFITMGYNYKKIVKLCQKITKKHSNQQ